MSDYTPDAMKINVKCSRCEMEKVDPAPLVAVELSDLRQFVLICPNGHAEGYGIENKPFELLFEMGCLAYLDGYYRESVSAFAAALERFYEFYAHAIYSFHGIGPAHVEAAWKHVANQSERQLGAFISCHMLDAKEAPALVPERFVKMRNNATHKGRFTPRADALEFGETVRDYICEHVKDLHLGHPGKLDKLIFDPDTFPDELTHSYRLPTVIDIFALLDYENAEKSFPLFSLESSLKLLQGKRDRLYPRPADL